MVVRRRRWFGSMPWLAVLACVLAGAALRAQGAAPAGDAGKEPAQVQALIKTATAEARKFQNAQPPVPWEGSAASRQIQALWEYGREHRMSAAGGQATTEALRLLQQLGRHAELAEKVAAVGIQEPVWEEVAWVLLKEALATGNFDPFVAKTTWVADNTQDALLRARLWFTIGRVHREKGRPIEAEAAFQKAADFSPDADLTAAAKGAIYEMWNLNPEMPAPAFSAQPLAGGDALSLAKLRGKVVVLGFWGST